MTSHRGWHLAHALSPTVIRTGLRDAYRDAFAGRRLAWASPAVALVGAFIGFYVLGLFVTWGNLGPDLPVVLLAVALGLTGLLVGLGLGWSRRVNETIAPASAERSVRIVAYALIVIGLTALILYFLRIGDIPLFRPGLEQARVDAAEEGGAALRVLAMLSIPGCWMAVAWGVHRRSIGWTFVAVVCAVVVAGGWLLTGNRAPAFQTIEVSLIVALLTFGLVRLGVRGVGLILTAGLVLVIAAGAFGAVRMASRVTTYGPPTPNAPEPNYIRLTQIGIAGYLRVPVQNLRYTMNAVPERIGWRLGATYLLPLATVLPGKQSTFDAQLKSALDQRYAGGGTVPGLLGESYANFGPLGWFFVPAAAAFVLTCLYRRTVAARSPAWWALYGYAIIHVTGANLSGLSIASIFPWEAYGALALPILWARWGPSTRRVVTRRSAAVAAVSAAPAGVPQRQLDDSDVV